MKQIKSYLAFTSRPYRWILFLLVPVVLTGIQIFMGGGWMFVIMNMMWMLYAETVADYFPFGGIAAKNIGLPEYIKASGHGREVLRMALAGNMIRQFAEGAAVLGIGLGVFLARTDGAAADGLVLQCAALLLLEYLLAVLMTTAARFFEAIFANLLIAALGVAAFGAGLVPVMEAPAAACVLLGIFAAAASVIGIRVIMKRAEESYYDRVD